MANGDTFAGEDGKTYMEWDGKWYTIDASVDIPDYHTDPGKVYGGTRHSLTPDNVPTAPVADSRAGRALDNFKKGRR